MNDAVQIIKEVSASANLRDAFRIILQQAKRRCNSDFGAVLKPTTKDTLNLIAYEGALKSEHMFTVTFPNTSFNNKDVTYETRELLFQETAVGANLKISFSGSVLGVVRLEWSDQNAFSREKVGAFLETLEIVAPILEHLKRYDTRISLQTQLDTNPDKIDIELDTINVSRLFAVLWQYMMRKSRAEGAFFALRSSQSEFFVDDSTKFGKARAVPATIRKSNEFAFVFEAAQSQIPSLTRSSSQFPDAIAIPMSYKKEVFGVCVLIPKAGKPFGTDEIEACRGLIDLASLHIKKLLLYNSSAAVNPKSALRLVGVPRDILELAEVYSDSEVPVLVRGETGTGKESLARFLHLISNRSGKPFVAFSCAELVETLAESQLFGHIKGAFTGAITDSAGIFQQADGGTLFLDEIDQMATQIQAKFLRAIESGELRPVGAQMPTRVNVRIVVASNKNLQQLAQEGKFLKDLYMRLDVLDVFLPPLRETPERIPSIADAILQELTARNNLKITGFTPAAKKVLLSYDYPGNIRELRNILEISIVKCKRQVLDVEDLPRKLIDRMRTAETDGFSPDFWQFRQSSERSYLERLLQMVSGNVTEASKIAGVHRTFLHSLIKKYKIDVGRFKQKE